MRKFFKSLLLLLPLLLLSACYEVEGYITNENGEPVKHVGLVLVQLDKNGTVRGGYVGDNVYTDAKGYYNISFSTDYPAVSITTFHLVNDGSPKVSHTKLDLNNSSQYRVDITIEESTIEPTLHGLIIDESGSPIKGASVTTDNDFSTLSYKNGIYSLPLLQKKQTVHISKESYVTFNEDFNYTDGVSHTRNFILKKVQ